MTNALDTAIDALHQLESARIAYREAMETEMTCVAALSASERRVYVTAKSNLLLARLVA